MSDKPLLKFTIKVIKKDNQYDFFADTNNYVIREGIGKKNWDKVTEELKNYLDNGAENKQFFIKNYNNNEEYYLFNCLIFMPFSSKFRKINIYSVAADN